MLFQANYSKHRVHTQYITKSVWSAIRHSNFYKKDYEIFSKIKSRPFDFSLYDYYNFEASSE